MNKMIFFFSLTLSVALCASTKLNNAVHLVNKNVLKGEKRYRRYNYKRKNARQNHIKNKRNLANYLLGLGVGVYAGEEALASYKKLKKESSVEAILDSECGQRYIDLIAERIEPHIAAQLEEKSKNITHILARKRVFRALKNNVVLPHEMLETVLLTPKRYPNMLISESLNNDIAVAGKLAFSTHVTSPILQQLLLNQKAQELSKKYAKYFVAYMLSDEPVMVPEFILNEFQSDIDALKKMNLDLAYLSATVISPMINNILVKSVDKIGPMRTICVGIPAITVPTALFFACKDICEKSDYDFCKKSYDVLMNLEQFVLKHPHLVDQLKKGFGDYQTLVTPEHLFLDKSDRPVSVAGSFVAYESKRIGTSALKKITDVTEPVVWAWKRRPCDIHRGIQGTKAVEKNLLKSSAQED